MSRGCCGTSVGRDVDVGDMGQIGASHLTLELRLRRMVAPRSMAQMGSSSVSSGFRVRSMDSITWHEGGVRWCGGGKGGGGL